MKHNAYLCIKLKMYAVWSELGEIDHETMED